MLKFSENPIVNFLLSMLLIAIIISLLAYYFPIMAGIIGLFVLILLIIVGIRATNKNISVIKAIIFKSPQWIAKEKRKGIRAVKGLECYLKSAPNIVFFFDINTIYITILGLKEVSYEYVSVVKKPDNMVNYEQLADYEDDINARIQALCLVTNKSLLNKRKANFALSVFDYPTVKSVRFQPEKILIRSKIPETSVHSTIFLFVKQLEDLGLHLNQAVEPWNK